MTTNQTNIQIILIYFFQLIFFHSYESKNKKDSHRYPFKRSDDSCISHYNRTVNEYYKLQNVHGFNVIAFDLPNCDLDGTYAPIQCENDKYV